MVVTRCFVSLLLCAGLASCGAASRGATAVTIDRPAPVFTAKHIDDAPFQLAALRGRVVVLDLWAAWCEGCDKELPVLDALASRVQSVGATVVSVSLDENPDKALRLLRAQKWTMTVLYDSSGRTGDAYGPAKLPAVYVIDRDGVIRDRRYALNPDDVAGIEARVRELSR